MPEHQNKHIREAIRYAQQHGWRVVKASGRHRSGAGSCALVEPGTVVTSMFTRRPEAPRTMRDASDAPSTIANTDKRHTHPWVTI